MNTCDLESVPSTPTLDIDPEKVGQGLAQLVLSVMKLLHELLERQALRRIDGGSLSDAQIEHMGQTLMLQLDAINKLAREFGLDESDLTLDLGPLGRLV